MNGIGSITITIHRPCGVNMSALIAGMVSLALIAGGAIIILTSRENDNTAVYLTMLLSFLGVVLNQLVSLKLSHDTKKNVDEIKNAAENTPPNGIPKG